MGKNIFERKMTRSTSGWTEVRSKFDTRTTRSVSGTVKSSKTFKNPRSSLEVKDSILSNHRGSLMQSIDGKTIPVKETSTKHLVLKKEFIYKEPQYYRVKYTKPALYRSGCLTCGRENASVQYYGERYCCV